MNIAYKVVWSKKAVQGVDNIVEYLDKNWGTKITDDFLAKLSRQITLISRQPELFPLVEGKKYIRRAVLTKQNTIFYEFKNNRVEVLYVFDTRQNPDKLKFNR